MAIIVERLEGFNDLIRTYSDSGYKIRQDQTGIIYDDAVDVDYAGYTYTETDIPIIPPDTSDEEEIDNNEALDIILGGE